MSAVPPDLGPYHLLRPLGEGGMGTVWLARDTRLDRLVALKFVSAGPAAAEAREQSLREARAAATLNHPNIATVHDVFDADAQLAIVFEYVEGETLAARLARGPLPAADAIAIAEQLASALGAAHAHGIVHRDLKPANVVLTPDGVVKVLDFGIARVLPDGIATSSAGRTTAAGFVGTVGYAAPEQCLGHAVDGRADLFSLGVVIYEMLTGSRPFEGRDSAVVVRRMLESEAPAVPTRGGATPRALATLVADLLAIDPAKRPARARDVCERLRNLLAQSATRSRRTQITSVPKQRPYATAALLAVALITAALVSTLFVGRPAPPSAIRPPVVAVLPLTNASGDSAKDYLAVGIADSLIGRLAGLPSVTVLSRAAVADAYESTQEPTALATALDATYLVGGSVQHAAETLRITLTLIRADASVAWADTIEGPMSSIFAMQTRLASALTQGLEVHLSAADRAALAEQPTRDAEALAAYWRGRSLLERRDAKGNLDAALAAFDEAISRDANFALAHAARGEALWARYLQKRNPQDAQDAIHAGTSALRLDPGSAQVRYSLALTLEGSGRFEEAIEELQRALAIHPNYDDARARLGRILARQGRIDEAVAEFAKAIELRPNYWGHYSVLGVSLFRAARYEPAIAAFEKVVSLRPDSAIGHQQLGTIYHVIGEYDEAMQSYERALAITPAPAVYTNLGALRHLQGDFAGAIEAYRMSLKLLPNSHITQRNLGDALVRLGRRREAQAAYREAISIAEGELRVNQKDARTMAYLAVYLAKAGREAEAGARIRAALATAPDDVQVLYRAAVVHELANQRELALQRLREALQGGFAHRTAIEDDDFTDLRDTPEFKRLYAEVSKGNS